MTASNDPDNIASIFRLLTGVDNKIVVLQQRKDTLMRMLVEIAGTTFMHQGQIFQVCERYNKARDARVPFFKKLTQWPKSWLDKQARSNR